MAVTTGERLDDGSMDQLRAMIDRQERHNYRRQVARIGDRVRTAIGDRAEPACEAHADEAVLYSRVRLSERVIEALLKLITSPDKSGNPYRFDEVTEGLRFLTGDKFGG